MTKKNPEPEQVEPEATVTVHDYDPVRPKPPRKPKTDDEADG
jgi:hypothetical protein